MSETRNTAVLKTNGSVWRNVRNRNVRFFPIFIFAAYCQCRQFDDNLATAIRHCICAMFSVQVRASISTCDAIFIRGLQNQSLPGANKYKFSNLVSKCSAKFALFSTRVYHVMFCTYYSPEGEMCCNSTDHA